MQSILNGRLCPSLLFLTTIFQISLFHLSWEGEGGGGRIHKRHLVFDLIKVEELATQVYLLVDG